MLEFYRVVLHYDNRYCRGVLPHDGIRCTVNQCIHTVNPYPLLTIEIHNPVLRCLLGKAPDRIATVYRIPRECIDIVNILHPVMNQPVKDTGRQHQNSRCRCQ